MAAPNAILLIDSHEESRQKTIRFLKKKAFAVRASKSFAGAIEYLGKTQDISLTVIAGDQPLGTIQAFLLEIKSSLSSLPIVLLSTPETAETALSWLEEGLIDHAAGSGNQASLLSAINNEFSKSELIRLNESTLKKYRRLHLERQKILSKALALEDIYDSTLENLMTALDLRDVETFGHSRTVAKYSQVLSQILGIENRGKLDNIRKGALLHDVGKIAIPDSILKKPGPLSPEEWLKIKCHPQLGFGLIKEIKLVKEVGNIILFHHEKFDGSGYPKHLKKTQIPLESRIFALADALDAITSHRPYRKKQSFAFAQKEILDKKGSQFDPDIVKAFCSLEPRQWEKIRYQSTKLLPGFEDMMALKGISLNRDKE